MTSSRPESRSNADPVAFLERFAPFSSIEHQHLEALADHIRTASYAAGDVILRQAGEPASDLLVVRSGIADVLDEGRLIDELVEGDVFGLSVLSGLGPVLSVRARTATTCYLLASAEARELLGSTAGLTFLATSVARWRARDSVDDHLRRAGIDDSLAREIAEAGGIDQLVHAARRLPTMVDTLLEREVDAIDIGHLVGATIDHLTTRLVELSIDDAGPPPVPFAWIALGSAARHEQALGTDQDHALAYDCTDAEAGSVDPYFAALAERVTDGLEACGIERCRGGVMAENPAWRRTLDGWEIRFAEYVADPNIMATRIAGIAFDYRRVLGSIDAERPLDGAIRRARADRAFMRRLGGTVLEERAPVGRRGDVVTERGGEHPATIDIKHGGIALVTNLARYYALAAGVTENRTMERLRAATADGAITDAARADLEEAFRCLWGIRLRHHVDMLGTGKEPDDHVDPSSLHSVTRQALGASLRVIADAQDELARALHRRG